MPGTNPTPAVDWARLSAQLQDTIRVMVHEEQWTGPDFYAEALRRAFGYIPAGEPGPAGRAVPFDRIQRGAGLATHAEARWLYEGNAVIDRLNLERAERELAEARAETRRVYREAGADLAQLLRERCNQRTVPSRFRREGVQWAADLIDPNVPKDRYGNMPEREVGK